MRLGPEDKKYAYVTLIIGIGMLVLAILLPVSYCSFTFGNTSCPTPDALMGIGASIGAVTTALFFYLIDKPAKDFLAKFSKSSARKDMLLVKLVYLD